MPRKAEPPEDPFEFLPRDMFRPYAGFSRHEKENKEFRDKFIHPRKSTREVQNKLSMRGIGPAIRKKDEVLERKGIGPSGNFYVNPYILFKEETANRILHGKVRRNQISKENQKKKRLKTETPRLRPENMPDREI